MGLRLLHSPVPFLQTLTENYRTGGAVAQVTALISTPPHMVQSNLLSADTERAVFLPGFKHPCPSPFGAVAGWEWAP